MVPVLGNKVLAANSPLRLRVDIHAEVDGNCTFHFGVISKDDNIGVWA